jgi:HNH endonuclease
VHHVDGDEQNNEPSNLAWACRSCNTIIGAAMKRAGLGRRTRQFNPSAQGARTLSQWVTAVLSVKGQSSAMEPAAAVEMIHATPPARRSAFAEEIWRIRREHGTDRRT